MATGDRFKASSELIRIEGLNEVIVGARVESFHAVFDHIARAEDENRRAVARGSERPTYLEAVNIREPSQE